MKIKAGRQLIDNVRILQGGIMYEYGPYCMGDILHHICIQVYLYRCLQGRKEGYITPAA